MIGDIETDHQEFEFSVLSPAEQLAELTRREEARREWENKIAEIKEQYEIITASVTDRKD